MSAIIEYVHGEYGTIEAYSVSDGEKIRIRILEDDGDGESLDLEHDSIELVIKMLSQVLPKSREQLKEKKMKERERLYEKLKDLENEIKELEGEIWSSSQD